VEAVMEVAEEGGSGQREYGVPEWGN